MKAENGVRVPFDAQARLSGNGSNAGFIDRARRSNLVSGSSSDGAVRPSAITPPVVCRE